MIARRRNLVNKIQHNTTSEELSANHVIMAAKRISCLNDKTFLF